MAERLTEYDSHGDLYVKNHDYISASYKLARYEDLETEISNLLDGKVSLDDVCHHLINAIKGEENELLFTRVLTNSEAEKWDKYKDLEEQGRLIELPCAVGDTVYEVQEIRKRIQEYTVNSIYYSHSSILIAWEIKDGNGIYSNLNGFEASAIGKTVFLTKDEAEAKLKELRGEQE